MAKRKSGGVLFVLALFGFFAFSAVPSLAQSSANNVKPARAAVRVWQDTIELPTYQEGLPNENPPFDQFVTNGRYNYPYTLRDNLTNSVAPHNGAR